MGGVRRVIPGDLTMVRMDATIFLVVSFFITGEHDELDQ